MQIRTDPQTGETTVTLSASDRQKIASAKSVMLQLAVAHTGDPPQVERFQRVAAELGGLLEAPETPLAE